MVPIQRRSSPALLWFAIVLGAGIAAALQVVIYGAPHILHFDHYAGLLSVLALPMFFLLPLVVFLAALKPVRARYPGKTVPVAFLVAITLIAAYFGVFVAFNLFGT